MVEKMSNLEDKININQLIRESKTITVYFGKKTSGVLYYSLTKQLNIFLEKDYKDPSIYISIRKALFCIKKYGKKSSLGLNIVMTILASLAIIAKPIGGGIVTIAAIGALLSFFGASIYYLFSKRRRCKDNPTRIGGMDPLFEELVKKAIELEKLCLASRKCKGKINLDGISLNYTASFPKSKWIKPRVFFYKGEFRKISIKRKSVLKFGWKKSYKVR